MKVDVTSDLHLDFWVDPTKPLQKQNKLIGEYVAKLLPEYPSDVLVIAGDIGHYNWQNKILFTILRKTYTRVLWVHGNHDLYLVSHKIMNKYGMDSFERLHEMIGLANEVDGVTYLDGTVIQLGDFCIGGGSGWYDGSYAIEKYSYGNNDIRKLWRDSMNDSNLIRDPNKPVYQELDIFEYATIENNKLRAIHSVCDLIVSHIAPDWTHVPSKYQTTTTAFYCFDGRDMLSNMKPNAHWVFGHTHDKYYFEHPSGPLMICNPLGYPGELNDVSRRKFQTIELGKPIVSYEDIFK